MIYTVEHDGHVYEIERPDVPSDAPVRPRAGNPSNTAPTAPSEGSKPFQRAGWLAGLNMGAGDGAFASGFQDSIIKAAIGLKDSMGLGTDEERAALKQMEEEAKADPHGNWRTTGDVTGNVALTAAPSVKAAKYLSSAVKALRTAAPSVPLLSTVGRLLTSAPAQVAALGGAEEALLHPGDLSEKASAAGKAAALSGALGTAGHLIAGAVKPSKDAASLMSQGVYPTVSQGAENPLVRMWSGVATHVLPTSKRFNAEVAQEAMHQVAPDAVKKTLPTNSTDIARLADTVKEEYPKILGKYKFPMTPQQRQEVWDAALSTTAQPDIKAKITAALSDAGMNLNSTTPYKLVLDHPQMQGVRDRLQDLIAAHGKPNATSVDDVVRKAMINAKNTFDDKIRNPGITDPEDLAKLVDIDHRYSDAQRLIHAGTSAGAKEELKVNHLVNAYKALDPTGGRAFAKSENPMMERLLDPAIRVGGDDATQARPIINFLKRASGSALVGGGTTAGLSLMGLPPAVAGLSVFAPAMIGQTKAGARAMFGDYEKQKLIADLLRNRGGTGALGAVGAGITGAE